VLLGVGFSVRHLTRGYGVSRKVLEAQCVTSFCCCAWCFIMLPGVLLLSLTVVGPQLRLIGGFDACAASSMEATLIRRGIIRH
jgi:hypothetical protein